MVKPMFAFFQHQTIKQRLRFWIGTVIVALGLTIILSFYINEKNDRLLETTAQLQQIVSFQSLYIERWNQERMNTIKRFAVSDNAVNHKIDSLTKEFEEYARVNSEFGGIFYVDADGYFRSTKAGGQDFYVGDRAYFAAARDKKDFVSGVISSKASGEYMITFSSPVLGKQGEFAGAVVGAVSTELLDKLIKQLSFGKTGEVYVLDSSGNIVTMSGSEKQNANPLMDTDILRRAQHNEKSDQAYKGLHGHTVYGQYQWSSGRNWIVVGEIAQEEVFENLNQLLITEVLIVLIALVLSFAATVTAASRVEKPIHYLLKGTKIIQGGNYDYQISPEMIQTAPIELRQLCHTYNLMASKLKDTITLLEHSALVDQLTEIYNRRYMMLEGSSRLNASLSSGQVCSVILLDIDHFKKINDTLGHLVGDRVLHHVAALLSQYADDQTIVGRYGGEEFIVLALNKDAEQSLLLAESIRKLLIAVPYADDEMRVSITASLGVAEYIANTPILGSKTLEDMISRADDALYKAKSDGRNRVELAD